MGNIISLRVLIVPKLLEEEFFLFYNLSFKIILIFYKIYLEFAKSWGILSHIISNKTRKLECTYYKALKMLGKLFSSTVFKASFNVKTTQILSKIIIFDKVFYNLLSVTIF